MDVVNIVVEFNRGDTVYLKTDYNQYPRMVTKILIGEGVTYELSSGVCTSWHYGMEISSEIDETFKMKNS